MPLVATVDGIKVRFYSDEHPPPHLHALYAEYVAQIRIDPPSKLKGSLPPAKLPVILAWAAEHQEFLMGVWNAFESRRKPGRPP